MKTNLPAPAILALGALLVGAAGCASPRPACCARPAPPSCCTTNAAGAATTTPSAAPLGDRSLYQSETAWTDDSGRRLHLGDLAGRPQVVAMFFTHCQFTCPVIINDLRRLEAALPPELRGKVGFTLVSFDSRRDSPAELARFREARNLPRTGWHLLHGESPDVAELAALLGVNYQQDARGDFSHSNQITLLDARGEIALRWVGLNRDMAEPAGVLAKLVNP